MAAPVTVWTAGVGSSRRGLTVSSLIVANGAPAQVLGTVDPESPLAEDLPETLVVNLLASGHEYLADAFAGLVPAPGGPFTQGEWSDSEWGPVLLGAAGWLGVRVRPDVRTVGWSTLIEGTVEHVVIAEPDPLVHHRGRYGTR